jgi:peptidoglycan/xylan/chitin deacetylase (PgdA/CDA1 family)
LRKWCSEGYGIALHGYEHGRWKDWTEREIVSDINHSLEFLGKNGFDINEIKIVVTPGFYNTRAIRSAVASKKMKMVMGANVVNPDTETFQWGRFFIKRETDTVDAREILLKAKQKKGFVVFGTHSSIHDEFSSEKTEEILKMALQIGLKFKRE